MKTYSLASFSPSKVQAARETVADWWAQNSYAIRREDPYASHVTEEVKEQSLTRGLDFAKSIRQGKQDHCFTILQRLIVELTGDCPAFLP